MLRDALAYPTRGDGAWKRIGVGGALLLPSILVLPGFLLYGYFLRVLGSTASGETEPPDFDDWGGMFVDGLKVFVVIFAYLLPVYVLGVVLPVVYTFLVPMGSSMQGSSSVAVGMFVMLFVALAPLTFLAYYLMPAGLVGLALSGNLRGAFDVESIGTIARSREYFLGMLLAAVVAVVGSLVASFLWIIVVGVFLHFYLFLSVSYIAGRSVAKAAG